ncbi:MAG: hypothetical protein U0031_06060 [Thermomicrobiales bacterium]
MSNTAPEVRGRREPEDVTRRVSLAAVGATLLGAVLAPGAARAGKKGKTRSKDKCKQQGVQCRAIVSKECGTRQDCLDELLPCCEFLARCAALKGLTCIDNADKSGPAEP